MIGELRIGFLHFPSFFLRQPLSMGATKGSVWETLYLLTPHLLPEQFYHACLVAIIIMYIKVTPAFMYYSFELGFFGLD